MEDVFPPWDVRWLGIASRIVYRQHTQPVHKRGLSTYICVHSWLNFPTILYRCYGF